MHDNEDDNFCATMSCQQNLRYYWTTKQ